MEGKKRKRKVGGIILLCMSFLLVIVLTFTLTLAWFFDSDWSSNYVTMAGSVGIEIRDNDGKNPPKNTSGSGTLHFNISTNLAYPGQAIDARAEVYNNGGDSVKNGTSAGSPCYIRARFIVYTNIGGDDNAYLNSETLYAFLQTLVDTQNNQAVSGDKNKYYWQYASFAGARNLSYSGTPSGTMNYYLEGSTKDAEGNPYSASTTATDKGYFYLCRKTDTTNNTTDGTLYALNVGESSVFLWNSQFIIPWQLTNYSADKHIFVAVEFQAIQTFIPKMTNGIISSDPNNQHGTKQEDGTYLVKYSDTAVQTVFNTIKFKDIETTITVNGTTIDFGDTANNYASAVRPNTTTTPLT